MLKRFFLALAFAGSLSPAFAAGTIPGFSLSQQLDQFGKPLANCFFYTIQAGTTSTPQNAYQDSGLTIQLPNPQRCSASGRLPQMFLADGSIKVRLTDKNGLIQVVADGILVVGPSGGGGGGSTVDPTTVLQTGWIQPVYGTGVLSGFVRANGRTIGSASSGATERANADCQALFQFLWVQDPNLTVSTGRGSSANSDWVANKTIALPDWRGRALAALDDMGNSAAGRLTASYFGATATTLGAAGGSENRTLITSYLPPYAPVGALSLSTSVSTAVTTTGTASVTSNRYLIGTAALTVLQDFNPTTASGFRAPNNTASILQETSTGTISASSSATSTATPTGSFTGTAQGGTSTPFATVSPMMLATFYIKL